MRQNWTQQKQPFISLQALLCLYVNAENSFFTILSTHSLLVPDHITRLVNTVS